MGIPRAHTGAIGCIVFNYTVYQHKWLHLVLGHVMYTVLSRVSAHLRVSTHPIFDGGVPVRIQMFKHPPPIFDPWITSAHGCLLGTIQ